MLKSLIVWAVQLYPPRWRDRYRDELLALIEDAPPRAGDVWDVLQGAMLMQMTTVTVPKIVAGFALAGVIASGVWTWMQPNQYVSTSILRVRAEESPLAREQRLQRAEQEALSRNSLAAILVHYDLYKEARGREPMEHVIRDMRNRNIRISPHGNDFAVEFSYPDAALAQKTARDIVTALQRADAKLEVLDAASSPNAPAWPNRPMAIGVGLLIGLVAGMLCGGIWALARRSSARSLKQVGAFAAAGMLLGIAVAFLIPDQFISTSIVRFADPSKVQLAIDRAKSAESVHDLELKYGLHISPGDVVIRKLQMRPASLSIGQALAISFRCSDRFKAMAATRDLAAAMRQGMPTGVEILDPASDPMAPSSPNRPAILLMGIVAGILLGMISTRFVRPAAAMASVVIVAALSAQSRPQFEVASIKRNTECGNRRGGSAPPVPGRLNLPCQTVMSMIQVAYHVFADGKSINLGMPDITGVPSWAETETYDLNAKAEDHAPIAQMMGPMLQALLEERFKVQIHRDSKEVSVYLLTVAKNGIKLEPAKGGNCFVLDLEHLPPPPKPGEPRPKPCGIPETQSKGPTMALKGYSMTMAQLAGGPLARWAGRPIVDKTGLTDKYDIDFEFAFNESQDSTAPSVFTALERLGLHLSAGKSSVETIVVDHVERPSEN